MVSIFKLDKVKIKGLLILIIGLLIPKLISYIFLVYKARVLGPEKFQEFLNYFNTNIPIKIILLVVYIVWLYIIVSLVLNLKGKK